VRSSPGAARSRLRRERQIAEVLVRYELSHVANAVGLRRLATGATAARLDPLADTNPGQTWILAQHRWISSLNGSSFDGRARRSRRGGPADRNAARIVLRANPVRRNRKRRERNAPCAARPSAPRPARPSPGSIALTKPGSTPLPTPPPPPEGGQRSTGEGVSFPPAPTAVLVESVDGGPPV